MVLRDLEELAKNILKHRDDAIEFMRTEKMYTTIAKTESIFAGIQNDPTPTGQKKDLSPAGRGKGEERGDEDAEGRGWRKKNKGHAKAARCRFPEDQDPDAKNGGDQQAQENFERFVAWLLP